MALMCMENWKGWMEGVLRIVSVAPCCELEGVSFLRLCELEGVGGPAVQPHTPVFFRT